MKKRNTTIFAFLLLAAVGMGVGYAAFSQNFDVKGSFEVNTTQAEEEFMQEIIFNDEYSAVTTKAGNKGTVNESITLGNNNHSAVLEITGLQAEGDVCVANFTVENKGDIDAYISAIVDPVSSDPSLFEIKVSSDLALDKPINKDGGKLPFTVTITMLDDPIKDGSYSFTIGFTATSVGN